MKKNLIPLQIFWVKIIAGVWIILREIKIFLHPLPQDM